MTDKKQNKKRYYPKKEKASWKPRPKKANIKERLKELQEVINGKYHTQ